MVKCTLDGQEIEVEPGTTILNAARGVSVDIPTFCYHDRLSISASCRMCLVEIEGRGKLEPACATTVAEDMVIHSHSGKVVETRGDMLEILLANHPLDCPICDKGGECELQDTVFEYGRGDSRLRDPKRVFRTRDIELNNVIVFNANRCIQCQRCVRMCEEVVGEVALGTSERGLDSEITGVGNSLKDCSHCGNCIEVCPVGALMSTPYRYKARPWDMVKTETICGMCGTGCSLTAEMRDGEFKRVKSDPETGLNGELLCAKGRFGFDAIDGGERVRTPMIRKDGVLSPVSWDEAVSFVAHKAAEIHLNGGSAQGLISPRQTSETAFAFQKLMRHVFKTNDLHSSCRFNGLRDNQTIMSLADVTRDHVTRKPLQDILTADCIFVLGANVAEENPVTGYLIRNAIRQTRNRLLIASSRPCGLDDVAASSLRLIPGNEAHLLAELANEAATGTGSDAAGFVPVAGPALESAGRITLLLGTEFLRSASATECLQWIAHTAGRLKHAGKTVDVQFLFDRPNQSGLWDMGCLPGLGPQWQPVDHLPIPDAAPDAAPDLVYALGADPLTNCAGDDPCRLAALETDFLVAHTSHMNRTAERAHVVLPAPAYGEENGTYTNNTGQPQTVRPVRHSDAPDATETLGLIADATATGLPSQEAEQLRRALAAEVLDTMTIATRQKDNSSKPIDPPAPSEPKLGSDLTGNSRLLITGDGQFHSGIFSNRSKTLQALGGKAYIEMNPGNGPDSVPENSTVTLICGSTRFSAELKINKDFDENIVFVPEAFLSGLSDKFLSAGSYPTVVTVLSKTSRRSNRAKM